ncbi:AraC family transcriptional regulator [Sphingobacteriaceae bacterium GW460-11-11-14-LB5]|nr:AraC family transcriptional regulator [Sphingobacteriaceae bacterium GW460-11-11-14-LB5]
MIKKNDGFEGQKAVIVPKKILSKTCASNSVINSMCVSSIGYYPKARFHYRKRANGTNEHILIYCTEGRGTVKIDKKVYEIEPNNFFIIPKGTEHVYGTVGNNPWTIYWAHFTGQNADSIVNDISLRLNNGKEFIHYSEKRIALFDTIYHQLERGYSVENMEYSSLCFYHFLGSFAYQNKFDIDKTNQDLGIVNRAIDYMTNNIQQTLSLTQMATDLNISASHLSFLFKQKTGYPPMEYVNHLKLQKACQYLMFTPMRIKEITTEIGMSDPFYFSRFFKRQMGMSPKAYRNKRKK